MTKTYIATAPDGSEVTRKTDRTYTHAVLLEGKEGWEAEGFCGRLDLANKKQIEHPGSIVVEVKTLGGISTNEAKATNAETDEEGLTSVRVQPETFRKIPDSETKAEAAGEPIPKAGDAVENQSASEPKRTISTLTKELLMDRTLDYEAIVDLVKAEFADAKTTTRSIASVASVQRKKGLKVPIRRNAKKA